MKTKTVTDFTIVSESFKTRRAQLVYLDNGKSVTRHAQRISNRRYEWARKELVNGKDEIVEHEVFQQSTD